MRRRKTARNMPLREKEEQATQFLLLFIDFLYAVAFGLILQDAYENVLAKDEVPWIAEKLVRMLLVLWVFYFLLWDWIRGRLLTVTHPYQHYARFFLEVLMAFAGFGFARSAVSGEPQCLVFLGIHFLVGFAWGWQTLYEYPPQAGTSDRDGREVRTIKWHHGAAGTLTLLGWALCFGGSDPSLSILESIGVILWIQVCIVSYECFPLRVSAIEGGPGAPFVHDKWIRKGRDSVCSLYHRWRDGSNR